MKAMFHFNTKLLSESFKQPATASGLYETLLECNLNTQIKVNIGNKNA